MAISYNSRIVTSGLVLCLDAANTKSYPGSGTAWTDLSGLGNHGTLVNGATYNSSNSGSIAFDGVNDRVTVTTSSYAFSGATLEMWFNITTLGRNQGYMGFNQNGYYLNFWMPTNNTLRWESYQPFSSGSALYSTLALSSSTWYHAVGTVGGGQQILYINGAADISAVNNSAPSTQTIEGVIGDYGLGNYPSASKIAVARVYTRALTAGEVQQNFNALRGRYGV